VEPPWSKPDPHPNTPRPTRLADLYPTIVSVTILAIAAVFARRNWKLGRVDRRGALRIALAEIVLSGIQWLSSVHAVASDDMIGLFTHAAGLWLFSAAVVWLVYLAAEPAIRARWPHALVTWNRVLAGRWTDAQVMSHALIGAAIGCALWQVFKLADMVVGSKDRLISPGSLHYITGPRHWIGAQAGCLDHALVIGLTFFFGLFVLRTLLKRDWMAAVAATLLGIFLEGGLVNAQDWQVKAALYAVVYFTIFVVLLRFGLLVMVSAIFFTNSFNGLSLGFDWTTWYAPYGIATMTLLGGIAGFAFWKSLGSRGLIGDEAAEAAAS
jgi:hypothetical protein